MQATHAGGRNRGIAADLLKGALAGAVGTWALDRVTWFLWHREDPRALARERVARPGGLDPAHVLANRMGRAFGTQLRPAQPHPAGIATHFAIGIAPAAIYGLLRSRARVPAGAGLLLGLGLFLLQDELGNHLMGLSGSPRDYPWQAHARGLAGHLAYGAATDAALGLLDRVGPPASPA